jgi:hypothetical protein
MLCTHNAHWYSAINTSIILFIGKHKKMYLLYYRFR